MRSGLKKCLVYRPKWRAKIPKRKKMDLESDVQRERYSRESCFEHNLPLSRCVCKRFLRKRFPMRLKVLKGHRVTPYWRVKVAFWSAWSVQRSIVIGWQVLRFLFRRR